MSSGQQSWADDCREEYYKENKDIHRNKLDVYASSDEFKRLVELREKFKEYREWKMLEAMQTRLINEVCTTINWCDDTIKKIENAGIE
jgi:hypothetical protein